jgi:hypothetical protein
MSKPRTTGQRIATSRNNPSLPGNAVVDNGVPAAEDEKSAPGGPSVSCVLAEKSTAGSDWSLCWRTRSIRDAMIRIFGARQRTLRNAFGIFNRDDLQACLDALARLVVA